MEETPRYGETEHETPMAAEVERGPGGGKGLLWGLIAVVIAFLIGFGWQFYQATTVRASLAEVERELVIERLHVQLANATISAQARDYEAARQQMSQFFNRLQTERWALPRELDEVADEFMAMRDNVITGLSRANPEYAGVLLGMLQRFEAAASPAIVGGPQMPQ